MVGDKGGLAPTGCLNEVFSNAALGRTMMLNTLPATGLATQATKARKPSRRRNDSTSQRQDRDSEQLRSEMGAGAVDSRGHLRRKGAITRASAAAPDGA